MLERFLEMELNLIYAIDKNYNKQCVISIKSFLEHTKSKINIHILHKDANSFSEYRDYICNEKNLASISVYEFNNTGLEFPRISGTHISEATYYRLYLDLYLPNNINNLLYIDADVLCINFADEAIKNIFLDMKKYKFSLAAKTDEIRGNPSTKISWDEIQMKNINYFNAGVLFINYQVWINNKIFQQLRQRQLEIKDYLYYWDQDILNSFFDGAYLEIENKFNYRVGLDSGKQKYATTKNNSVFIHYQGSWKPWSVRGCFNENSRFYQDYYKKIGFGDYHIVNTWRINSIGHFIVGLLNLKLFRLNYPLKFINSFTKSLLSQ